MANLFDCFGHWSIPPSRAAELANADAILTHEFGDQKNISLTTKKIVMLGAKLAKEYKLPLVCQYPGNIAAHSEVAAAYAILKHGLKPGEYLDTEEVNRQMAHLCGQHGWKRVIVCTHAHHLWRAGKNLEHHGIEVLYPDTSNIPYDPACSRAALRTPLLFVPREILARILYLRKGYI